MKPMLAHKLDQHKDKLRFPAYVQPKLDGVRCTYSDGEFQSRSERIITSVPKLLKDVQEYFGDYVLDGELFTPSLKFEDINSCVSRTVNIQENMSLNYWVYDVPTKGLFRTRWEELVLKTRYVIPLRLTVCPTLYVRNYEELLTYFNQFIAQGFEGLIYRHADMEYEFDKRSYGLLKLKPWHTTEVKILNFEEGKGRLKGTLGAMVCRTLVNSKLVKVGSGLDDALRNKIWNNPELYGNNIVTIKYQELTKAGVPRFPIFLRFRDE